MGDFVLILLIESRQLSGSRLLWYSKKHVSACPDWHSAEKTVTSLLEALRINIYALIQICIKHYRQKSFILSCFLRPEHPKSAEVSLDLWISLVSYKTKYQLQLSIEVQTVFYMALIINHTIFPQLTQILFWIFTQYSVCEKYWTLYA